MAGVPDGGIEGFFYGEGETRRARDANHVGREARGCAVAHVEVNVQGGNLFRGSWPSDG